MRSDHPGLPVSGSLSWPLRSITKSFTVTLLLKLADEGRLDLDDPVGRYVRGVPNGDAVTLRDLAAMTSGLPDYTTPAFFEAFQANPRRIFSARELLAFAWRQPLQGQPGEEAVYTNVNTLLLGEVIRAVTGRSFERSLRRQVLRPLGLRQTLVTPDQRRWPRPRPVGYQREDGQLTPQPGNLSIFRAAGEMLATLPDLRRWAGMLGRGRLLSRSTAAERRSSAQPLVEGPEYDSYGLGLGSLEGWWGHTGEGLGFTALVMYEPRSRARAAIAMNISNLPAGHPPTRLFRRLARTLKRDGITGAFQRQQGTGGQEAPLPVKQLDAALEQTVRRFGIPGVAAGVWLPGGRRWRRFSGEAVLGSSGSGVERQRAGQGLPWVEEASAL
ncbi:beta-lactamase [Cyanobium sp. PCC 7001]|uniref:serine hydrolase domain-containing protein n=1 Tax=Cyanobium sp. PCC 7001 TaxID=180281 RepID=UPI00018052F7|nr:serine hydrolase domain-containing protein [Cyanobium sp. PCC 7001]EDY39267.1 beta-lactamase [Cyanobium sp. PCC 7001]